MTRVAKYILKTKLFQIVLCQAYHLSTSIILIWVIVSQSSSGLKKKYIKKFFLLRHGIGEKGGYFRLRMGPKFGP